MKAVTITDLQKKKQNAEKFAVITSYDATFTRLACEAGIAAILVGDSLGNVLQGQSSTVPVSLEEMVYHTRCVSRGNTGALIIADLPFMTYATPEQALQSSAKLMQAGAHMVKLEGGLWLAETIQRLVERGIPVCAHLGLTPQSVNVLGGYKVQGREASAAQTMIHDAKALEQAGAACIVLECVPKQLAGQITQDSQSCIIGIGAGNQTDAQVLVLHDMLGLNPRPAKFVKNFMQSADSIQQALLDYNTQVIEGTFPEAEHSFE